MAAVTAFPARVLESVPRRPLNIWPPLNPHTPLTHAARILRTRLTITHEASMPRSAGSFARWLRAATSPRTSQKTGRASPSYRQATRTPKPYNALRGNAPPARKYRPRATHFHTQPQNSTICATATDAAQPNS